MTYRRQTPRIAFSTGALVRPRTKDAVFGKVRDVARDSIYLYTEYLPDEAEDADIDIVLVGTDSQLAIKTPAVVVRKDQLGVAFRFRKPLEWWPVFEYLSTSFLPRQ